MQNFINEDLEQLTLGAVLQSPDYLYKIPDLQPGHFHNAFYGEVFSVAKNFIEYAEEFNIKMLFSKFSTDEQRTEIWRTHHAAMTVVNIKSYADEVMKLSTLRKLHHLLLLKAETLNVESDVDQIITDIDVELNKDRNIYRLIKEKEVCSQIYKNLQEDLPCYSTGLDSLDYAMAGGLFPRRSYCFAADQKAGKSVILATLSHNLSKQKVKHLYIAVEMSATEIMQRNMAHDLGKNALHFLNYKQRKAQDFQDEVGDYALNNEGTAYYVDTPGIQFDKLRRLIVSSVRKYNLAGVFLDYLQIVSGAGRNENDAMFQGRVAQWIAECCKKENIWCVYAAQKNREGQLRGSDGIKNAVDQLYMVFKPDEKSDSGLRWMDLESSRYTRRTHIGELGAPAFKIDTKGPYLIPYRIEPAEEEGSNGMTEY